ncbi:MAG: hypothetical protein ACI82G_002582 [Bradymonadia bacterium]|jgi:hypothetical protein
MKRASCELNSGRNVMRLSTIRHVVLVSVLGWAGCTPNPSEPFQTIETFAVRCDSSAECGERRDCRLGACGVIGASREVSLSFSPPEARRDLAAQSVLGVNAVTGAVLPDYSLQPAVALFGQLSFDDAPGVVDINLRGLVTLSPSISVPGGVGSVSFYTDRLGRLHDEITESGVVRRLPRVMLAPGTYDATVWLTPTQSPFQRFFALSVDGLETDFDLQIPSTESLQRISGRVEMPQVDVERLAGASVSAVSPDGRVGEAVVVVVGVDEASFAQFSVPVDPDITELEFRIAVTDPDVSARFERILIADLDGERVQLVLPAEPEQIPLTVDALSALGARPSGAGNLLWTQSLPTSTTALAEFPGVTSATLSQRSTIETSGGPTIAVVYAGEGRATFIPDDDAYGLPSAVHLSVDGINDPTLSFDMPLRQPVTGWFEDPDTGVPIANARISATLLFTPDGEQPIAASQNFGASVVADNVGRFDMSLQPGVYEVFAVAPVNISSAAATRVTAEVVAGDPTLWPLIAVRSGVVAGRLLDSNGEPIVGAAVEAWPADDSSSRPRARAATDKSGEYRLLLPVP